VFPSRVRNGRVTFRISKRARGDLVGETRRETEVARPHAPVSQPFPAGTDHAHKYTPWAACFLRPCPLPSAKLARDPGLPLLLCPGSLLLLGSLPALPHSRRTTGGWISPDPDGQLDLYSVRKSLAPTTSLSGLFGPLFLLRPCQCLPFPPRFCVSFRCCPFPPRLLTPAALALKGRTICLLLPFGAASMGCVSSKQFARTSGYEEDPTILAKETTCKSLPRK
jgi:hypothetical protein